MRKNNLMRPVLPACLLVADKPCLVVGGGSIAARKTRHLLDAEARVTVVAAEASDEIRTLAQAGKIRLVERAFTDDDVKGQCLVFATTDKPDVNWAVLEACRRHGVLASASDANWPDGDFVTPAICREGGVVVGVSTGGRSCSRAKLVKEKISELLKDLDGDSKGEERE